MKIPNMRSSGFSVRKTSTNNVKQETTALFEHLGVSPRTVVATVHILLLLHMEQKLSSLF
jgi:hypothetical protein